MFLSRQTSFTLLPRSASRNMRILSSVVYRLPFIVWSFLAAQTNTSGGPKKRSHVTSLEWGEKYSLIKSRSEFTCFDRHPDGRGDEHEAWFDEATNRWFKA